MHRTARLPLLAALLAGCADPPAAPQDASVADITSSDATALDAPDVPAAPIPTEPVTVPLFERAHVFFTGMENRRTVDGAAQFPDATYARATLTLTLACPSNRCDAWDRVASLSILDERGGDGGAPAELEIARFVTPYGVGGTWSQDVTDLMPLLRGPRRVRVFIDTWVGPGSSSGNGWLVTASVTLEPGAIEHPVRQVIPLGWSSAVYGDPARPIASQLPPRRVEVPAGVGGARLWVTATGHGQGNRDNCAEFCPRTHAVTFDDQRFEHTLWRDDCAENPIRNQRGNWQPPRAGWCPGDLARPWIVALPKAPSAGPHTVGYDVESYENTCRPGATPCAGCVFRTSCDYNDGTHTEPHYRVSAFLLLTD